MKILLIILGLYLLIVLAKICAVLEKNSNDTLIQILSTGFIETIFCLLFIFIGVISIDYFFDNFTK